MGETLSYEAPAWVGPNTNTTPRVRAMRETAHRMIQASMDDSRIEELGKDEEAVELINAARIVSQFFAKRTGDVDAAVAKGTEILDLSLLPDNQ